MPISMQRFECPNHKILLGSVLDPSAINGYLVICFSIFLK